MTQYNSLNVKLSNPQLNKLKSAIKNEKSSTDIKLSKAQMIQSGGFLGRLFGPLLKTGLS